MKVNIVARPDHSLNMYSGILESKSAEDEVNLFTFYALKEGGYLSKLFPRLKTAPRTSTVLNAYTFITRISNKLLKKLNVNTRENESRMFELLAPRGSIENCDVLHYWPFYCARMVENIKQRNKDACTVAEYYEAEPQFVNAIYNEEYERFGLESEAAINLMIDQNFAYSFESDFIVASEFTKKSYQVRYPDKIFHVCKYGPSGYTLDDNLLIEPINRIMPNILRLVFVGQICLEKGVHYLLEAVKDLDVSLELIGPVRGGQEDIFKKLLSSLSNVKLLGSMRHSDVLEKLSDYDAFCLPSLADNYSLAVVEALSKGKPVIVTENCGNAEDIESYNLGLVAKVKNSESIKECIEELSTSFDYSKFNIGVKAFFSEENRQAYPRSVLDVYSSIVGRKK